jgi:hypothetical protein
MINVKAPVALLSIGFAYTFSYLSSPRLHAAEPTASTKAKTTTENRFLRLNPGYDERVSKSYESTYVPEAARKMTETVNDPRLDNASASRILRDIVYEWMDVKIEGEGIAPHFRHQQVIDKADSRVKALVGDGAPFQRYREWRLTTDRWVNPMEFLMRPRHTVDFRLTQELSAKGWRIRYVEGAEATSKYGLNFKRKPLEVIIFEKMSVLNKVQAYLHLVVYRTDDFFEYVTPDSDDKISWESRHMPREDLTILKQISLPTQPKGAPEIFWNDHRFVIFFAEGDNHKAQKKLQQEIRYQLWRPAT